MTIFRIDQFKNYSHKFKEKYQDFSRYNVVKIDKENKRNICGFECYKVILESNRKIIKMYVTDEIELNYHPVLNDINILKNYYPLYLIFIDKRFPKDSFTEYKFIRGEP